MTRPDPSAAIAIARGRVHAAQHDLLRHRLALAPSTKRVDVLLVRAAERWLAAPLLQIREVVPACWCEPMPGTPDWVHGTFSLEQTCVSVVDIQGLLHGHSPPLDPSRFVVVTHSEPTIGLVVEELGSVTTVELDLVTPPTLPLAHAPVAGQIGEHDQRVGVLSIHGVQRAFLDSCR